MTFQYPFEVTDEILSDLVHDYEYVAVYFKGDCLARESAKPEDGDGEDEVGNDDDEEEVDCEEVLAELETIDDDLSEIGIIFVTTEDTEVATANGECLHLVHQSWQLDEIPKFGNVWGFVQLILRTMQDKNRLHKNPNIAKLRI